MRRPLLLSALVILILASIPGLAQDVREVPPPYRGPRTLVNGVFVTPVSGAPFTATVQIESVRTLPTGATQKQHTMNVIARDSSGRIHNERRALMSEQFKAEPPVLSVHVFDPATRISETWSPATMICREQTLPPLPAAARDARNPDAQDLGASTLEGFEVRGTRTSRTIPAVLSGTGKPIEITDEIWYSEDLHMNLRERHTDPRTGVQTVTITSIDRNEPDPALFEVPSGYKIVDLNPPPDSPVARMRN